MPSYQGFSRWNQKQAKKKPKNAFSLYILTRLLQPFPRRDGTNYAKNSSHEITKLLPETLPPRSQFNPTDNTITILNPTAVEGKAVRVEYAHIRKYTSELHASSGATADLILHIGMADGWDFVSCERRSYKQTFTSGWTGKLFGLGRYYMIKDVKGKTVEDAGPNPWGEEVPMGLCTGLDVDGVVEGASKVLKSAFGRDVRAHEDAGTYCCGFIYYESLANKVSSFFFAPSSSACHLSFSSVSQITCQSTCLLTLCLQKQKVHKTISSRSPFLPRPRRPRQTQLARSSKFHLRHHRCRRRTDS